MFTRPLVAVALSVLLAAPAAAEEFGTAEEAKALVLKAAEHANKVGLEIAYKDFSDTKGAFVDRDLYLFCTDADGLMRANGNQNALIGRNLKNLKDTDGKELIAEAIQVAASEGEGWIHYRWTNPTNKKIEPKSAFVKKVGAGFCAAGFYRK
ncbi:MAG TPA: cache domain-containing protein [Azospirillaceae bacterium]|nr:cache domain-containing protein [Azospirillaceae bacterium]